jgi:4'-phosphopantetheinyl transferase EntD
MAALDLPPRSIPQGADRAPVWPRGIVGSISHTSALCVAAVSQTQAAIGVDLEPDHPLEAALIPSVCTQREIARLPHNRGRVAKLIFCAKEAAYKAQYALSASLMDFKDFDISFAEAGQFQARFSRRVGPFAKGSLLHGRHGTASGHLVTAVAIAQAD